MGSKELKESITERLKNTGINEYRSIPFWSWNDKLEPCELT